MVGEKLNDEFVFIKNLDIVDEDIKCIYSVSLYEYRGDFDICFKSAGDLTLLRSFRIQNTLEKEELSIIYEQLQGLPEDQTDLFHQDYRLLDSGNSVDTVGVASSLLNGLRRELKLNSAIRCFDKVSLKRYEQTSLTGFHIDYFDQDGDIYTKAEGHMYRYFVNLGKEARYLCFAWIPRDVIRNEFPVRYHEQALLRFLEIYPRFDVVILPIPAPTAREIFAVSMNVFDVLHTTYGMAGDLCGIVTDWLPHPRMTEV